jgi:hypothetical protein
VGRGASSGLKSSGVVSILADHGKPYSSPTPGSLNDQRRQRRKCEETSIVRCALAAVGALALIAAGCGGGSDNSSGTGGGGGGSVRRSRPLRAGRCSTRAKGIDYDRDGPADAGRLAHADAPDRGRGQVPAPAAVEGRRQEHRLPGM